MALHGCSCVLQILMVFAFLFVISQGATDTTLKRKVKSTILCQNASEEGMLVHTAAVGPNDTLHYMISTRGLPTVLVVRTNVTGKPDVNCTRFFGNVTEMEKSINFTEAHYAYAVLLNRLFEYNDTQDVANLKKLKSDTSWNIYELDKIDWHDFDEKDVEENKIIFTLDKESQGLSFLKNGSLSMEVMMSGMYHRDTLLPHLEYNANMTMFNLILDHINTSFTQARYAIEMTMVSMDGVPNTMDIRTATYIDDEHSPGVFQMIDWTSKGQDQTWSGFFQFKPVCYTSPSRSLGDATRTVFYDLHTPNWTTLAPPKSVAYAYFGMGMYHDSYSLTMTNVSFGLSMDKFYTKTYYTIWTASIGFGKPPADELSVVIIIVLSVGLGLPMLLILFGGIGIFVKKRRSSNAAYQEITSDDPIN